jgi:hypothetical protein
MAVLLRFYQIPGDVKSGGRSLLLIRRWASHHFDLSYFMEKLISFCINLHSTLGA